MPTGGISDRTREGITNKVWHKDESAPKAAKEATTARSGSAMPPTTAAACPQATDQRRRGWFVIVRTREGIQNPQRRSRNRGLKSNTTPPTSPDRTIGHRRGVPRCPGGARESHSERKRKGPMSPST